MMTRRRRFGEKGFTLMEIIVVLAVIASLAAVLVPVVFRYIDDAKKAQAQADANMIAASINQMYKDTGRWAFYKVGTSKLAYTSGTDAALLTSNDLCTAPTAACDTTAPADTTTGSKWALATALADGLTSHLIKNTPAYATTGSRAWKGPYTDKLPQLDPWGKSYLVNIANADPTAEGSTQKWVIVISAGPNGNLESDPTATGTSNPSATGDDIIARAK